MGLEKMQNDQVTKGLSISTTAIKLIDYEYLFVQQTKNYRQVANLFDAIIEIEIENMKN